MRTFIRIQEDIVTKLFEFLEAPQATTSELLADKELVSYVKIAISLCKVFLCLLSTCYVNDYYVCLSLSVKQR